MTKFDCWPPPKWTEIVVPWNKILDSKDSTARDILDWVDSAPGGRYHLHGLDAGDGFAFRFERPRDAVMFAVRWSQNVGQ